MRQSSFDGYVEPEVKENTAVQTVKTAPVLVPTVVTAATPTIPEIKAGREAIALVEAATGKVLPPLVAQKVIAAGAIPQAMLNKAALKTGLSTTSILLLVIAAYMSYKMILNPKQ
jgi:hypothetical protein